MEKRAVAAVLDRVAVDFPDLDKGKYGYEPIEDGEMLRVYFRQLLKKASPFPVVGHLAEGQALWSAADVEACQFDRDVDFEELCIPFRDELASRPLSPNTPPSVVEGEDLEGETDAGRGDTGDAGVQPMNTEADASGGNKSETDKTALMNEIKRLKILLDLKDGEIGRLDKLAEHLRNEFDAKYNALQIKADSNEARYLQLKEDYADAAKIEAEHAEYERVIHELGGKTISEVEADALEAVRGVVREFQNRGASSWEVADYISELRYLTNLFPIILTRHPIMTKWLGRYPQVQPAKKNACRFRALSPTVPSRLVKDRLDMMIPVLNPRPIPNRGDGNYRAPVVIPRGRSSSRGGADRGRGGSSRGSGGRSSGQSSRKKEDVNIDFLLNPPTSGWASYFNCSKRPDGSGPSNA